MISMADYNKCVDKTWFIRPIVACIPAYMRFAQCLRRYRDTKETFPHLVNAMKYTTTFFVVIFSTLYIAFPGKYLKYWLQIMLYSTIRKHGMENGMLGEKLFSIHHNQQQGQ